LIQFMPELVHHREWMVDMQSVHRWLEEHSARVLVREMHHRRVYIIHGAEVEVVDPVFNPDFCSHCHRIRVTHQGELKGCLNRKDDRIPTRGLDDLALREAFRQVITTRIPYYGGYITDLPPQNPSPQLSPGLRASPPLARRCDGGRGEACRCPGDLSSRKDGPREKAISGFRGDYE